MKYCGVQKEADEVSIKELFLFCLSSPPIMRATILHLIVYALLFGSVICDVKYVSLSDNCTPHESTSGKAVFCCNERL